MSRQTMPHGFLTVHSSSGVTIVPLTGDPRTDAILERIAKAGRAAVTRTDLDNSDLLAREVMRND